MKRTAALALLLAAVAVAGCKQEPRGDTNPRPVVDRQERRPTLTPPPSPQAAPEVPR